ncbi:MAG: hypothetical protein U9R32_09740, partial [Bacteroidota bacterium]|nr:hypothetical protein [Bacteroidota bacterium]
MLYLTHSINLNLNLNLSLRYHYSLSFCLDAKERKSQGLHKNIIHLFAMPKFGRVIFEQVLSFPVS